MALAAQPDLSARLRADEAGLRARLEERAALMELLRGAWASPDPALVAQFLVQWAPSCFPAPGWAVVATDSGNDPVTLAAMHVPAHAEPAVLSVGALVIANGQDFYAADLRRVRPALAAAASVAAYALVARQSTIGALVGIDPAPAASEPRLGDAADRAWHELLEAAGAALANAQALRRAEALSVTDDLTRLYNRRYLNEALRRETKRAARTGRPVSVLFVDLDGFKAVNDTFDHLHGSRVLAEAATVMHGCARETDVVARFGGDEFVVVLPDTGAEGALAVAGRIRDRVTAHRFLAAEGHDIRLTVSVGAATLPDAAGGPEDLLAAADQAMYRVKAAGKDGISAAAARSSA